VNKGNLLTYLFVELQQT